MQRQPFSLANDERVIASSVRIPVFRGTIFDYLIRAESAVALGEGWVTAMVDEPASGVLRRGSEIALEVRRGSSRSVWRLRVTALDAPSRLVLEQVDGPYTKWRHEMLLHKDGAGTLLEDQVCYAHVGGGMVQRLWIQPDVEQYVAQRQRVLLAWGARRA
jgi:ligand-binding SRPBCC domain-containing protein